MCYWQSQDCVVFVLRASQKVDVVDSRGCQNGGSAARANAIGSGVACGERVNIGCQAARGRADVAESQYNKYNKNRGKRFVPRQWNPGDKAGVTDKRRWLGLGLCSEKLAWVRFSFFSRLLQDWLFLSRLGCNPRKGRVTPRCCATEAAWGRQRIRVLELRRGCCRLKELGRAEGVERQ
jgi:hypothetical protein